MLVKRNIRGRFVSEQVLAIWSQNTLDKNFMDLLSLAAGQITPKLSGNLGQHKETIISQLQLSGCGVALSVPGLGESLWC